MVYRFIQDNYGYFGLRWLFRRLNIYPNGYYNFLKNRKSGFQTNKQTVLNKITELYHEAKGRLGHRKMRIFLLRKSIVLSKTTVHKYMNKELRLFSLLLRKKPGYVKGKAHKLFPNLLGQNFSSDKANQKWCTDFTYLFLKDGRKRYNCSIIDLKDRSVVASLDGKEMTAELAIKTLKKALSSQPTLKNGLILHSDQGSQYTSRAFTEFLSR